MKQTRKTRQRKASAKKAAHGKKIGTLKASTDIRDWSAEVEIFYRPIKKPVTLRLDADVIAWFKAEGPGYQTRINRVLREVMMAGHKRK